MRYRLNALVGCLTFLLAGGVNAQTPDAGQAMATEIQNSINRLAPFTQTSCRAGGGRTPDAMSFLTFSLGPIWDNADAKQAWLEAVVESVGDALRKNATANIDEVIVADVNQLTERVAWGVPIQVVKDAYGAWKDGRIRKDEMYPLIEKGLVRKPINSR